MDHNIDVAIIGMSCIFPGAPDVAAFWKNIINRVDAIQTVPENRMESMFFDGEVAVDRFYCRRGGFIDDFAEFDPIQFGILPLVVESTEPEQLLALHLAHKALNDAGVFEKNLSLEKTGIIIGKGNYPGPGAVRGIEIIRTGEQIVRVLQHLLPNLRSEELDLVKKEFQVKKGRFGPDTAMGLIPNLVASLVANRLNLGGTAYTIDAACASSLIAVDHAVQELSSRRSDMVIAGGVHASQNAPFWSIFTQLGALSRNQQIRPFDQRADGVIIGEGCGFVVLKRLEDAIRDGHRIYAVVKGVGVSSDGAGVSVMSPSVKGQTKAILQAWQQAGADLRDIGLIEAHGTATQLGDKTELETLLNVFGSATDLPKAGIGTIKSMIGHAMPAAGIAGLIKTALALHHGQLPPTLHCEEPLPFMEKTRFTPIHYATPWDETRLPRRAGVNAFGFGGINAHVVMEAVAIQEGIAKKQFNGIGAAAQKDAVLLLARPNKAALLQALETNETFTGEGAYRIAIFDPTPERIQRALKIVNKDVPWRNRQDIWFSNEPMLLQGGKIAFLFPGLDGLAGGETSSVAQYFNLPGLPRVAATDGVLGAAQQQMENSGILDSALKRLGVQPHLNAGHSLGEWLAGRAAEMVTEQSLLRLQAQLDPTLFEQKNATFLVAGCGYERLKPLLAATKDIYLSIDNCPQQVILCGTNEAVEEFIHTLKAEQVFYQVLPFQSGFHSPFVKDKLELLLDGMNQLEFQQASVPVWSATTLTTYPDDVAAIRALSVEHLVEPVRFRELTEKLYETGVRVFVQVGAGGLIGFVDDTLKQKNYSAVAASVPTRSGLTQLQRVLAALFVEGQAVDSSFMEAPATAASTIKSKPANRPIKLQLGSPIVRELPSLKKLSVPAANRSAVPETAASPLMQALLNNFAEISDIQQSVMEIFQQKATHRNGTNGHAHTAMHAAPLQKQPLVKKLDVSLDTHPYLIDHSLIRQRPGWHCADDCEPVIPMTMILEMFGDIAKENAPGMEVQKIMQVKVFQWMNVATPFRETVKGEWKAPDRIYLDLEKYANAEVHLSQQYGTPEKTAADIGTPLQITITPQQIYSQRMFHGPAYQGITEVKVIAEKGIAGIIEGGAGKGSLLDNAGQLFGLWLQLTLPKDRIAFPVKIQEVEFYQQMEDQQGSFECTCQLTSLNDEFAFADFILKRDDKVWAIIRGWQNRRLEIDEPLWNALISPKHTLAKEIVPGVFMFHNAYSRVNSWDFIVKRYFNQEEKKHHNSMPLHKKKEWVISRVAVKDAVKALLLEAGNLYYPVEFAIRSNEAGQPFTEGDMTGNVHISLAHKNTDAVAIARFGKPVGIDIEEIREHNTAFEGLVFDPSELALLGNRNHAEWLTRYWVAKEAYGKSLGKGLQGNPKAYVVEAINGETLTIQGVHIQTIQYKNYIIGWTS
ncbi:Acyl transferase domain-containing protein [Chitinophaga rupis]|uniref:Acyl transferase domain-containing protein n=1 Tax=Chitinophaga rupis TaxID=573321 RepID=A0A1H7QB53_9BACT|nr:type I polyketide synthase [Chitinophaga rupis]SEL44517.1 Acyl transferase domain-containing protein [Chitinophaga rupis]